MQVTIDTGKDSKDDIRRAIAFLQGFVKGGMQESSGLFSDESKGDDAPIGGMMGMFGGDDDAPAAPDDDPEDEGDVPEKVELVPY